MFAVQRTQVMESELAAAHPEIQTWSGTSLDNPGTTAALDVTPMGFHAAVRGPNGQGAWYVDPAYDKRGTSEHLAYYASSLPVKTSSPVERELPELKRAVDQQRKASAAAPARVTQRTYRLALISDPTYADYFGSPNVLAEKATLIHRANQIYNDDVAIRMILVNGHRRPELRHRGGGHRPERPVRRACLLHPGPRLQRLRRGPALLLRRRHPAAQPDRPRSADRGVQLRPRPHRARHQRRRHRRPRRRGQRREGDGLHRDPRPGR